MRIEPGSRGIRSILAVAVALSASITASAGSWSTQATLANNAYNGTTTLDASGHTLRKRFRRMPPRPALGHHEQCHAHVACLERQLHHLHGHVHELLHPRLRRQGMQLLVVPDEPREPGIAEQRLDIGLARALKCRHDRGPETGREPLRDPPPVMAGAEDILAMWAGRAVRAHAVRIQVVFLGPVCRSTFL